MSSTFLTLLGDFLFEDFDDVCWVIFCLYEHTAVGEGGYEVCTRGGFQGVGGYGWVKWWCFF